MAENRPGNGKQRHESFHGNRDLDVWILESRRRQVDLEDDALMLARARHRVLTAVTEPKGRQAAVDGARPAGVGGWATVLTGKAGRRTALLAGAVLAIVLVVLSGPVLNSPPAVAAVNFENVIIDDSEFIIASIDDPFLATDQYNAAFAERGLSIEMTLVPASPSMVGNPVAIEDGSGDSGIRSLADRCSVDCPLGIRVPIDFDGAASITLGRPATSGEQYVVAAPSDAPGEPFHDLQVTGMTAGSLRDIAGSRGIRLAYQTVVDGVATPIEEVDVDSGRMIVGSTTLSENEVLIWLE